MIIRGIYIATAAAMLSGPATAETLWSSDGAAFTVGTDYVLSSDGDSYWKYGFTKEVPSEAFCCDRISETKPSEMTGEEQIKCIRDAPEYDRSIPAIERAAKRKQFREDCIRKLRGGDPK